MRIDRRDLAVSALALVTLSTLPLSAVPTFAAADDEALAKNLEAFRAAQVAANAEALASLCAAELSYSHSDGRVEDKATFIANATSGKSKFLSLEYKDPSIRVVGPRRDRAVSLAGRTGGRGRRQEKARPISTS